MWVEEARCVCCGEKTDQLYLWTAFAPYMNEKVDFPLCKVCMSRFYSMVAEKCVGDPYDPLIREEMMLRTQDLHEKDAARKSKDLARSLFKQTL